MFEYPERPTWKGKKFSQLTKEEILSVGIIIGLSIATLAFMIF